MTWKGVNARLVMDCGMAAAVSDEGKETVS